MVEVLLYVQDHFALRPQKRGGLLGTGIEGGRGRKSQGSTADIVHFTSTETVGLLETGAHDVHLDFHTAPEL